MTGITFDFLSQYLKEIMKHDDDYEENNIIFPHFNKQGKNKYLS